MKDYMQLSDDALIDVLVTKTKRAGGVQLGVESGEPRLVSRTGRKQDGEVSRVAEIWGSRAQPYHVTERSSG